ncbi:YraN family protein [Tropheryma whipplei]|uniref:YraN family protein n=1 Tax=Tropheryma whipplei TaxID=2039 RepID=UPI0004B13215|nr:YraN family protein [Tropheryma whipplei]
MSFEQIRVITRKSGCAGSSCMFVANKESVNCVNTVSASTQLTCVNNGFCTRALRSNAHGVTHDVSKYALGRIAEDKACNYLSVNGYIVLDRNWYCRFGELDIIARKNGVIVAVEVKGGKRNADYPICNITVKKLSKLTFLLKAWLHENKLNEFCIDLRIDAVSVTFIPELQIRHFVGIL